LFQQESIIRVSRLLQGNYWTFVRQKIKRIQFVEKMNAIPAKGTIRQVL